MLRVLKDINCEHESVKTPLPKEAGKIPEFLG